MDIEEYADKHIHYFSKKLENIELELIITKNNFNNFIDIGSGDGSLLYSMKFNNMIENFNEVWAVDLSQKRLEIVKEISRNIKTIVDDAQTLAHIPDNYFDLIVSRQVIEHVKDDGKMINSLYRICTKGGIVYLDTVFKKKYAIYFYRNHYGKMVLDPTHEREYQNCDELLEKIKKSGFKIVHSSKNNQQFPLINFFTRRFRIKNRKIHNNDFIVNLRKIKVHSQKS
jgi:ubiquinone/menaquinone biosynthesis C-methylase UbiE